MAQAGIRMDDAVKRQAEEIFAELGLSMSAAVNIFLKQVIRKGGLPFEMTIESRAAERQTSLDSLLSFSSQNRRIEPGYTFNREAVYDK